MKKPVSVIIGLVIFVIIGNVFNLISQGLSLSSLLVVLFSLCFIVGIWKWKRSNIARIGMPMKEVIIIAYCLTILLACIYVPWKAEIQGSYNLIGVTISLRYSPIWVPPGKGIAVVDFQRVILEVVGITALAVVAIVLVGGLKK